MATAADSRLYRERMKSRRATGDATSRKRKSEPYVRECKPFVGCDGEGGGTDDLGRQNYLLLRIGDRELETGSHLTTEQCLEFICQSPADCILVGFYFGYDATMILRDLDNSRLKRLFDPWGDETKPGQDNRRMRWTYYKDYGIKYLPRQFLSVCRLDMLGYAMEGTARTIYETGGFFQGKFTDVITNYDVATPVEFELIDRLKGERSSFETMTDTIREYNRLECDLLARLMEKFRDTCKEAELKAEGKKPKDLQPRTWNGAGKLATRLHSVFDTVTRAEVEKIVPADCLKMSAEAYYGGRFEVTTIGKVKGPIHEYDISSAYPNAMLFLPCLRHGQWKPFGSDGPSSNANLYVASVYFIHKTSANGHSDHLYGLPIRDKSGTIYWPNTGNGTYWSVELESAAKLGCQWKYSHGYEYVKKCSCKSFSWVSELFDYRKSLGKSAKGYAIKLGLNSLYGKFAQRIGNPRYGNFLYASLITARTRAMINDAISSDPSSVLMIATDGIYSTRPLPVPVNDRLGEWEHKEFSEIFIVKPGLYWTPDKLKTRGINKQDVSDNATEFERLWQDFATSEKMKKDGSYSSPVVPVKTNLFTGLKLAYARGKPETAGKWMGKGPNDKPRYISFSWHQKRQPLPLWKGQTAVTIPFAGDRDLHSYVYSEVKEAILEADIAREEYEEMPDAIDSIALVLGESTLR